MMNLELWLLYFMAALVATSTPGPAVLLIINRSIQYGWKNTIFLALGNISALFLMSILTISGLGVLLQASELLFSIVKYLGACYLIYMGVKIYFKKETELFKDKFDTGIKSISRRRLYGEAFAVAVSNPKAIIFLSALFPQFISTDNPFFLQFFILITTLMVLSFSFLMSYSLIANQARVWISKNKRRKYFNRISGGIFFGLGILLAGSGRK